MPIFDDTVRDNSTTTVERLIDLLAGPVKKIKQLRSSAEVMVSSAAVNAEEGQPIMDTFHETRNTHKHPAEDWYEKLTQGFPALKPCYMVQDGEELEPEMAPVQT